jgi:hypothetical protein
MSSMAIQEDWGPMHYYLLMLPDPFLVGITSGLLSGQAVDLNTSQDTLLSYRLLFFYH